MELHDLVGPHRLQGVDIGEGEDGGATLDFVLDGVLFRCLEDASDGWRSYMDELVVIPGGTVGNMFQDTPVVGRFLEEIPSEYSSEYDDCDMLELVDVVTGLVVLRVGTCNIDDYYPYYIGAFYPQAMACNQAL